jgi:GMP synthase (glutamine-hydrolysing)
MSILVLRHEPFEHLGHFATFLQSANIPFEYKDLGQPLALDERRERDGCGYSGVIIMGGPQSANDANPGLDAEMRLIGQAIEKGLPVLGVCLGAQLIAKALGARVYKNSVPEIGWAPVHFTEAAKSDPLFGGFATPTTFFHWHGETFDIPQGAEWLAYSDNCRHQAFRYGRNVYALQFHPEIEAGMILDWWAQPVNCGDVSKLPAPIDPHAVDSASLARAVLQGWLRVAEIGAASEASG